MSTESETGRWWENYLVRYLMPSIAGVGIVAWLMWVAPGLREVLFFGKSPPSLDAPTLTLLILYGNLFCYVASYPILCFHVTRVIDFEEYQWRHGWTDGYVVSGITSLLAFMFVGFVSGRSLVSALFVLAGAYSAVQCLRFAKALSTEMKFRGFAPKVTSLTFAYISILAQRRGIVSETSSTEKPRPRMTGDEASDGEGTEARDTKISESRRFKDFTDSYRHMREHGNSAFIFALEFTLAAETYGILKCFPNDAVKSLSVLAVLYLTWSFPAVFVHLLAQHLERRFSTFERWRELEG